jgi:hypothetical protein
MRSPLRRFAVVAAGSLAAVLVAGPASAVPTETLNPSKLPRGADVAIPHVEGTTVVDGPVRIAVDAANVRLLGKTGTAYVVGTSDKNGEGGRVRRVEANGTSTDLGPTSVYETVLSGDGQTVVSSRSTGGARTVVKSRSATTGALVAKQTFQGYETVLDAQGTKVVIGGFDGTGTQLWDTATDAVTDLSKRSGYRADLSLDLLASFTKDPYDGGCTVLSSIAKPGKRLWQSCTDAIVAFSTDGSHLAVADILSDGLGPNAITVRTAAGKPVGNYRVNNGWFGELVFESPDTLLLETSGPHKTATVRCKRAVCERASDLTKTPSLAGRTQYRWLTSAS